MEDILKSITESHPEYSADHPGHNKLAAAIVADVPKRDRMLAPYQVQAWCAGMGWTGCKTRNSESGRYENRLLAEIDAAAKLKDNAAWLEGRRRIRVIDRELPEGSNVVFEREIN